MILYLHGFRSSPQSFKAQLLTQKLGGRVAYASPQLPASPAEAIALAQALLKDADPATLTIIGSSLGGYYATWLAETLGCRAVLLNPAVNPARELEKQVGTMSAWHSGTPFEFKQHYVDELQQLAVARITRPERYFLIAATGDEVLDWQEMVAHYASARHRIIKGSDHGLSDFAAYIDEVLAFCAVDLAGSGD
jgi:predicted esterase YcpF (UPF0227 family)